MSADEHEPGSIGWWRAEVAREPLAADAECFVRGAVLQELLRGYVKRERSTTFHCAVSVDIDRFTDARLERDWLSAFAARGATCAADIRSALPTGTRAGSDGVRTVRSRPLRRQVPRSRGTVKYPLKYPLQALTLIQPWAHAIARLGKRIENRTWTPPEHMLGRWIAIHAGKKLDREAIEDLQLDGHAIPVASIARGAIVAVARLDGWVRGNGAFLDRERRAVGMGWALGGFDPAKRSDEIVRDRWWAGPVGWVLGEVRPVEPVPHVGAQGLWVVSPEACRAIRAQFEERA